MSVSKFVKKMMFSQKLNFKEGEFELMDIRGLMLPVETFGGIIEREYNTSGEEIFDTLFEAGRSHGKLAIDEIGRKNKASKKEFLSKLWDSANMMGLGKLELRNYTSKSYQVRLTNSPIVSFLKNSEKTDGLDRPVAEITKGIGHGIAEEIFESEIESEFLKSEYKGDRETLISFEVVK